MPKNKQTTHSLIDKVMKEEFLTKGFENASMRHIAKRCGLSTAALYRHYAGKEEMFASLVSPFVQKIDNWSKHHAETKYEQMEIGSISKETLFDESLIDLVADVIYPDKEMYCLLFYHAQGSRYENYLENVISSEMHEMMHVFSVLKNAGMQVQEPLEEELHMLLSVYMNAILQPVIHLYSKDKMVHCLQTTKEFFLPGWMKLMGL